VSIPPIPPTVHPPLELSQFDYALAPERIAQTPAAQRTASRLLHLDADGQVHDRQFLDLPALLRPRDLLIFNDTRVIKARLLGRKASGGNVEVLIERIIDEPSAAQASPTQQPPRGAHRALAHVKASKSPKPDTELWLADGAVRARVLGRQGDLFALAFDEPVLPLLQRHGATPLPPYISHAADAHDEQRYQTVYAREPGAVAAPTAGLHFDESLLARLDAMGVQRAWLTLHVGAGTFQPVRGRIADHIMHAERFVVPAETLRQARATRQAGGRVIAVGTTSVRAMESVAASAPDTDAHGDTRLFITPGYRFRWIDAMITNFHLPQSTLLMLVSAFAGVEPVRRAYAHAVREQYRFFSYGDAMFIQAPAPMFPKRDSDSAAQFRSSNRPDL